MKFDEVLEAIEKGQIVISIGKNQKVDVKNYGELSHLMRQGLIMHRAELKKHLLAKPEATASAQEVYTLTFESNGDLLADRQLGDAFRAWLYRDMLEHKGTNTRFDVKASHGLLVAFLSDEALKRYEEQNNATWDEWRVALNEYMKRVNAIFKRHSETVKPDNRIYRK